MPSYARLGITIVVFFLQHICPCISELLESSSEGRNCAILSYIFFYHASLNTDFFFSYVITIPLSHFKITTLFLCGLQLVQFTWAQLPHWCLFAHFIWTVISKVHAHISPFSDVLGAVAASSKVTALCFLRSLLPEASWLSRLLYFIWPTAAQSVTSTKCSLWVWLPLEWHSLLYMASGTSQTCSALVVVALLSSKETLDTSKTHKCQPRGLLTNSEHAPRNPS